MYQTHAKTGITLIHHTIVTPNTIALTHILAVVIIEALSNRYILIALILSLLIVIWAIDIYFLHDDIVADFHFAINLIFNIFALVPGFEHDIQFWVIRHDWTNLPCLMSWFFLKTLSFCWSLTLLESHITELNANHQISNSMIWCSYPTAFVPLHAVFTSTGPWNST